MKFGIRINSFCKLKILLNGHAKVKCKGISQDYLMSTALNRILNQRLFLTLFQRGQIRLSQINLRIYGYNYQNFKTSLIAYKSENELNNAVQNLDLELKQFKFKI